MQQLLLFLFVLNSVTSGHCNDIKECRTHLPTESNPVVTCTHSSHYCRLTSYFYETQRTDPNQWITEVTCHETCTAEEFRHHTTLKGVPSYQVQLTNCCSLANIDYAICSWQISSTNELQLYVQKPPDPIDLLPTETSTSVNSIIHTSATALPSSAPDNDDKHEIPPWILITIGTVLTVLSIVLGIINAWLVKANWRNLQQQRKLC